MMASVKIESEVTGDDGFSYKETHEFGNVSPEQTAMIAEFLADMADLAQDLGQRGEPGDLKATLRQEGIPTVGGELVVEGFSKRDMTRFQHRFSNGWDRLIDKFDDRRKGRGRK